MRTIALALAALAAGGATPWKHYVVSGAAAARGIPATVTPAAPATIVWSHEVAGNLQLTFAAVAPNTLVRVAFSETAEYLGIGGTSDWSRTYTTDAHLARSGETWTDTSGCEAAGVCADGYRAFRFARVYVDRGSARIVGATVRTASPGVATPRGWFLSSDDELNRIWYAGAYTAQLAELPNDPAVLGSGCTVPADARVVLVDGAKRDRCPWVGDQVVTDPTLFLANGAQAAQPVADTLSVFANAQLPDGYIPASPAATSVLFDYPAYFVLAVDEYLLYRGDTTEVSTWWPSLAKVLDTWYPGYADANGLLEDPFPAGDYAYVQRGGPLVAYYNALYARALEAGADVADALGHTDAASRWRARAASLAAPFAAAFWDATAGAFSDTPGAATHPTDGNAFAVLAGLATPAQTTSALARLAATTRLPWGNGVADSDAWSTAAWGSEPSQRVYPFISYFDVLARFEAGDAAGALDELRRTWGWMLTHTPTGTDWEAIGAGGTVDGYERAASSLAAGWSTGAVPALTNEVLGVVPTGPGFSTFDAIPHPAGLAWAEGGVPTPSGTIVFAWKRTDGGYVLQLRAPKGLVARVGAPVAQPRVVVDGKAVNPAADGTVTVSGSHTIEVLGG